MLQNWDAASRTIIYLVKKVINSAAGIIEFIATSVCIIKKYIAYKNIQNDNFMAKCMINTMQ